MKVKDLITVLSTFHPNTEIQVRNPAGDFDYASLLFLDKTTTPQNQLYDIFIDTTVPDDMKGVTVILHEEG